MNGIELNKLAAAILLAGIIAMTMEFITEAIYTPVKQVTERGYKVEGAEEDSNNISIQAKEFEWPEYAIGKLMVAADSTSGEKLFKKCAVCHDITKGGPHKVGPNLWGTVNHNKAGHEGYTYSSALKGTDGTWDYEALFKFLHSPKNFVKGTKMGFAGINKENEIADIIAYLREHADSKPPLPPENTISSKK
ncbi:c-type cytochrome [Rickettsiales endosymbiont of Stachyamoeba lipophora]|uniref:c-type cytochrome n=1 Tax=Rickettsiales endosymbiont of Stachyamoeba lipophora TaxID=2486578 RepID=UPI000F64FEA8|nr:cytochrome c family protein [Rickettsiales endosymbiont of Stachyamoeba lipophora]AZL15795.1 cytochrome c family protein [Rickettsiales endosymbiont of Stachyamoeba lipophora]